MALEMKYFVLKPKAKSKTDVFAEASQNAMIAYADSIRPHDSQLAEALTKWARQETVKQEYFQE